jgi:hypothetical protein
VHNGKAGPNIAAITTQSTGLGGTGTWTANVPIDVTSLSNTTVTAGTPITWEITKPGGTGKQLSTFSIQVNWRPA